MKLDKDTLYYIAEDLNSPDKKALRREDYTRFLMYNGKTLEVIRENLKKEFKSPDTIEELSSRIIPINIVSKIIDKLSGVYLEAPLRNVSDGNESDQLLMDEYSEVMNLNLRQKEANRYFKLFKRNLQEVFLDDKGVPSVRNLPRHTYEVYSIGSKTPEKPNVVVKILNDDQLPDKQVLAVWTDEDHKIVNGSGAVLQTKMQEMDNLEGINPYGVLPFVYMNEASYSVDPLPDDDLIRVAIATDVILSDLAFSIKYQTFSLIWTIGDVGDIPANPSSVISMDYDAQGQKPEIGTVKPEVDILAIINYVTNILSTLLSSKNLKATTIKTTQASSVSEAASGISKMLDQAESVEDKKDQQAFFFQAERELWDLLAGHMIPFWRGSGNLAPEVNKEFSGNELDVFVVFREPAPFLSEEQKIANAKARLESGFSTYTMELKNLYPHMRDEQIEELKQEILLEKRELQDLMVEEIDQDELQSEV